jgi:hypothetical protein
MNARNIRLWMKRNVHKFIDCGEVDCTGMVEAWDRECASGGDTLDTFHPAWDIAVDVAEEEENA